MKETSGPNWALLLKEAVEIGRSYEAAPGRDWRMDVKGKYRRPLGNYRRQSAQNSERWATMFLTANLARVGL